MKEVEEPDSGLVTVEYHDDVALITLSDPERRNALSHAMSNALASTVRGAVDSGARAVVLTAMPPVFCAGGSIDDLLDPPGPLSAAYEGLHALAACPVPTIAAVGGPAIGAGVSLPLACDVVVVSSESSFDPRFLDIAIHPGGGHLWYLARRVGHQGAAAMVLCGDVLTGQEAVAAGLAWRCVAAKDLMATAMQFARRTADRPPGLVARTKDTLRRTARLEDPSEAERIELEAQEWSVSQTEYQESVRRLRRQLKDRRRSDFV
ncbi:MAG TPA: enoyl-CoA hydratase-related protein [Acidimicrobiales bacterium]|nr:enoyl-CoA hydratase-related protein [Acidimicrobiales bacterium]